MNITISDKTADFLAKFSALLEAQNNQGTAPPFFYVVRGTKKIAAPAGQTGDTRYYYQDASFTEAELEKYCQENGEDYEHVKAICASYDLQEIDEHVNVFFTIEGYQEHIKLNGHNYRHYESYGPYLLHAFRNPEIASLLEAIKEVGRELRNVGSHK